MSNGRKFIEVANKVSKTKPIFIYKAGITEVGARQARSHTGSLAGRDEIYTAAFRKAGVMRVYDSWELFLKSSTLSILPPSKGSRVGIIASGGGIAVVASDICSKLGLEIPALKEETVNEIEKIIPKYAAKPLNPIDTAADINPLTYLRIAKAMIQKKEVDNLIVNPIYGFIKTEQAIRDEIKSAEGFRKIVENGVPLIVVSSAEESAGVKALKKLMVPVFETPEDACKAIKACVEYGKITHLKR